MISAVSSTDSVVCVTYATRARRAELERLGLGDVLDEDRRVGRLAHRADDLLVVGVADQEHGVTVRRVAPRLDVHLRHERAGRVDHVVPEGARVLVHGRRDAVRGVDDRGSLGHVALVLDEDRASRLEVADDVDVVDDLLADVDGGAVVLERALDRLDGALDAGAVAARARRGGRAAPSCPQGYSGTSARGLREHDPDQHDPAADELRRGERSRRATPTRRPTPTTISSIEIDRHTRRGQVAERPEREDERKDRPRHDHPERERPDRRAPRVERAVERHDVSPRSSNGKLHHGCRTAQKADATPSARQASDRASRCAVACSPARK